MRNTLMGALITVVSAIGLTTGCTKEVKKDQVKKDVGTLQIGVGSTGVWLTGDPQTLEKCVAKIFVTHSAGTPTWTEDWYVLRKDEFVSPSKPLKYTWETGSADPNQLLDKLKPGDVYYNAKFDSTQVTPPTVTEINNRPTNPTGAPFLVRTNGLLQGSMFRVSHGSDKFTDYWLLNPGYVYVDQTHTMTQEKDAPGPTKLKAFLLAGVSAAKWFMETTYTLKKETKP